MPLDRSIWNLRGVGFTVLALIHTAEVLPVRSGAGTCSPEINLHFPLFLKSKSWFSMYPIPQNCLCSPVPFIFKPLFLVPPPPPPPPRQMALFLCSPKLLGGPHCLPVWICPSNAFGQINFKFKGCKVCFIYVSVTKVSFQHRLIWVFIVNSPKIGNYGLSVRFCNVSSSSTSSLLPSTWVYSQCIGRDQTRKISFVCIRLSYCGQQN